MNTEELRELDRQIAEHEGWTRFVDTRSAGWAGRTPEGLGPIVLPFYSTDWTAAGPLIEKYKLDLTHFSWGWTAGDGDDYGDTPLEAICKAVLGLPKG